MKDLRTDRLLIRALVPEDYADYADLMAQCFGPCPPNEQRAILDYMVAAERGRNALKQPPYGDRAVLRDGVWIGSVGLVPSIIPDEHDLWHPQMGMFWAIRPDQRGKGYAKEAAGALMDFAFTEWKLHRMVATCEAQNTASQGVMRSLGMRLEPYPQVSWWQVLGIMDNPRRRA
jgi:RimJ/RimL family protein N-acetyltransferase